jgi:hypothetical protein
VSFLEQAYAAGRLGACMRFKLAEPAPTSPIVQRSGLLTNATPKSSVGTDAMSRMQAPTDPQTLKQVFNVQDQGETKIDPGRKLAAEGVCTTCRKERHYGPCLKPSRTRPAGDPLKSADFNPGMSGSDPMFVGDGDGPSTSAYYTSATSDSSLARARDGRPAAEQAAMGFANLFRNGGITSMTDESTNTTGGLGKAAGILVGPRENRGPTVNPYEERPTIMGTPIGWGDEGPQRIERAFSQIDNAADSTCIEGNTGMPDGPDVLG